MNEIERIFENSRDAAQYSRGYLSYLGTLLEQLDHAALGLFADTLLYARKQGAQIFFIGNGGSASTASHFANDLLFGTKSLNPPFKAISLCDNIAMLSAVANDFSYEQVFSVQLKTLMHSGDVVVAISASGNSPNVLDAVRYANSRDAITVGLTGFDGGELKSLVKVAVHVPSAHGEYGPVEDLHLISNHVIGTYLMQVVRSEASLAKAQLLRSA